MRGESLQTDLEKCITLVLRGECFFRVLISLDLSINVTIIVVVERVQKQVNYLSKLVWCVCVFASCA